MNPVALVTGASRGIGRGIALELAGIGYDLVVNYAGNSAAAEQTRSDCVARAKKNGQTIRAPICQGDVSRTADRQKLIEFTRQTFGRLDLLVNNAGVAPNVRADILEATEESFDRLIGINLKGPYFLTQLTARWMVEQVGARSHVHGSASLESRAPYRPKIIIISSVSAYTASVNRGDYCISKAALSMVTRLYAARLAEYGINVYEIRPGVTATDMTGPVKDKYDKLIREGLTPIPRWGTPEEVAAVAQFLASQAASFMTGSVVLVDGGQTLTNLTGA